MENVPRNPEAENVVRNEILAGLERLDPGSQEAARINGWDAPGIIPGEWTQSPQRPQPGQSADINYQGPRQTVDVEQIRRENDELKQRLAAVEAQANSRSIDQAIADAAKGVKLPENWGALTPEQQEQFRTRSILEALKPLVGAKPASSDPRITERLEDMDLRMRFRDLSSEQVAALRDIKKTRNPQSDQELIALASVVHPGLFPVRGQQSTGYVAPPGRGMPDRNAKPGFQDLARATQESRGLGTRTQRDRLGAAALRALAEEDPQLFTKGR